MRRLFEVARPAARPVPATDCTDIEPLPRGHCPNCHSLLALAVAETSALFFMHGHGYNVRTSIASCPCGYRRHQSTTAHNPRAPSPATKGTVST